MRYKARPAIFECFVLLLAGVLCMWLGVPGLAQAGQITASAFRIEGDNQLTSFEATLSADVGYAATVMPDPFRVIIDLADVGFNIPAGAGRKSKGLVKSVRYGIIEEGKSRIVIDTLGPVLITKSKLTPATGKQKSRITLELMSISEDIFLAAFAKDHQTEKRPPKPETRTAETEVADIVGSVTKAPDGAPKTNEKSQGRAASAATAKPKFAKPIRADGKKVVVIDPGHGGIDPGAVAASSTKEKDVVLAFALALKEKLDAEGRHHVVLTRSDDTFVSLKDRVALGRSAGADLFIAIHADTVRGQSVTGTTVYTLSENASDAEADALAQKENRADVIVGMDLGQQKVDVADILVDLVQRESMNNATLFSRAVLKHFKPVTKMTGKPLRSAGFTVLKAPDVPSILIELGFLSNPKDEERLRSPAWQGTVSGALARAIDGYLTSQVALNP
jgi:N-acetylmuramoyl-L-alanine amidase